MIEIIKIVGMIVSTITGVTALILTALKPFRRWLMESAADRRRRDEDAECAKETDRCLLRNMILSIYYKHCSDGEIKQYAYENMALLYQQYKKLDGNSFIDKAFAEAQEWRIVKD